MSTDPLLLVGSGRLLMAQPDGARGPGSLTDWAVRIDGGMIGWVGSRGDAPATDAVVDLGEALVTPGLVDSHTHPAFVGDRSDEAAARLEGAAYTGGGILRTVATTRAAGDQALRGAIADRLRSALASGTTTIECKSGYGLSMDEELRALRLIGEAADGIGIRVVRTLLAAHAVPPEAGSREAYVDSIVEEMIPAVANAGYAEFCDVFCDEGFFSTADAERILRAATAHGLGIRMHAEQLARTGGAELAARLGAASADHLEQLDPAGIAVLARSTTVATLLPGPALVMRGVLPPARALIDAGATVALASDANAGTFGSSSMPLVIGLAATMLEMTVGEAMMAATAGGAAALRLGERRGVIRRGYDADVVAWNAEHEGAFALRLGEVRPLGTWIAGRQLG